ncbi:RILP-like protein 2 isoform X2 [Entelurus aequoreus]|uniref:RILP-like protein 2 isoform X2 n=1 Tax=Entelurus aequoreus TaxID=161455 RepID=UPI002B1D0F4B|nr:RILP-like protein 2 isoform X2 [Entelurus aequoreus]
MDFAEESSPALAFEKEALELTVEDVYDISYVIGRDLLRISHSGEEVSDLQFRIVRVLEMFETMVNKYNLSLEELKMERDNLKTELDRIVTETSTGQGTAALHHAGAEGGSAGEEPAESPAHGGPGRAAALQEWNSVTGPSCHGGSGPGPTRNSRKRFNEDEPFERREDNHQ